MTTTVIVTAGHKGATVRQNDEFSSETENSYSWSNSNSTFRLTEGERREFVVTDTRTISISEDQGPAPIAVAAEQVQLNGDALDRARAAQRTLIRQLGDSAQNAAEHEAAVAILAILDEAAGVE